MASRQRNSRKRDAILACLRSTETHPSAEWIYENLKPDYPDLSLGTVYRNLAQFREQGLLRCVTTVNGVERLDACTEPHTHFVCDCCGAVIDAPFSCDTGREEAAARGSGFSVRSCEVLLRGLCPACAEAAGKDTAAPGAAQKKEDT